MKSEQEVKTYGEELLRKLKACKTVGSEADMGLSAEITAIEWVLGYKISPLKQQKLGPKEIIRAGMQHAGNSALARQRESRSRS